MKSPSFTILEERSLLGEGTCIPILCAWITSALASSSVGLISTTEVLISLSTNLIPTCSICTRLLGVVDTSLRTCLIACSPSKSLVIGSVLGSALLADWIC